MEFLQCKACGSFSMVPLDVEVDDGQSDFQVEEDQESRFYSCQVCGDNWLSIKQGEGPETVITFIHQMGIQPHLKRVAHMDTHVVMNEQTVDHWDYYFGDEPVDADEWREQLDARRKVLKSICSN